jgi:hypothetical protein
MKRVGRNSAAYSADLSCRSAQYASLLPLRLRARPGAGSEQALDWLVRAMREFENASTEDPIVVADSHRRIEAARA